MSNLLILAIVVIPMLSGVISWYIGNRSEKLRDYFNIAVTTIVFALVCLLYKSINNGVVELKVDYIMGTGLYLKIDMFRYIFVFITSLVWMITTIYSTQYLIKYKNRNRYYCFFMMTLGSTLGVFVSENMINLFTFFEIMSFTSYILVIHDEDSYAHQAGVTYISMAIFGGLVLLLGLFLAYDLYGTVDIASLSEIVSQQRSSKYIIAILLIFGFGIKASIFPLHIWLPKAHPAAPTPASAILSGILLKVGIYGIMLVINIIYKDSMILSWAILLIGFLNMSIGGILAVFQRNVKRILAYSSMSQVGFILVGIGLIGLLGTHNQYAVLGTLFQILNHAIFKVLLFLCAGVIYMIIHELSINKIRGFGKYKMRLKILFFIAYMGIIGMPGFNGFASKNLIHEALLEAYHMYHLKILWVGEKIFVLSAALTVAYITKIFVAVFLEHNDEFTGQYKGHFKIKASFPMAILGVIILILGINPQIFIHVFDRALNMFGDFSDFDVHIYNKHNLMSSATSIGLGLMIYFVFVRGMLEKYYDGKKMYINPALNWFSLENHLYIPVITTIYKLMLTIFKVVDRFIIGIFTVIIKGLSLIKNYDLGKKGRNIGRNIGRNMGKNIFKNTKEFRVAINNINHPVHEVEDKITTLSDLMGDARENFNSISYAVFIFGLILLVVLFVTII